MEEFIYLEVDEEITSVIDRLREAKSNKVGIVVPRGAMVLQSVVNLKLIQREAAKQKKHVAIITIDKVGRSLATQVGLPVYDDPRQAETSGLQEPKDVPEKVSDVIEIDMSKGASGEASDSLPEGVKVNYYTGESVEGKKKEALEAAKKTKPEMPPSDFSAHKLTDAGKDVPTRVLAKRPGDPRKLKLKIWISIAAVVVALIAAWLVLTRATVNITVPAESYEAKADVKIDATLMASEPQESKIKGALISAQKEMSKDVKATGTKKVGEKAKGKITFYNDDGPSKTLKKDTVLTAKGSKLTFTLQEAVSVPGAVVSGGQIVSGKAEGDVIANESGTEYNLPSSTEYSVGGGMTLIRAQGETSGGTTEEKKIVSADDITGAEDSLIADAPNQLRDELKKQAGGEYVVDGAINYEAADFTTSKKAGEETDSFTAKANVKAQVIAFKESDLREAVAQAVQKTLTDGKSLLISDEDIMTPTVVSSDIPKKELTLNVKLDSHIGNAVSTEGLAKALRGKSVKSARELVASKMNVPVNDVQITVRPNTGLVRLPFFAKNIKFKMDYKPSTTGGTNENPST